MVPFRPALPQPPVVSAVQHITNEGVDSMTVAAGAAALGERIGQAEAAAVEARAQTSQVIGQATQALQEKKLS